MQCVQWLSVSQRYQTLPQTPCNQGGAMSKTMPQGPKCSCRSSAESARVDTDSPRTYVSIRAPRSVQTNNVATPEAIVGVVTPLRICAVVAPTPSSVSTACFASRPSTGPSENTRSCLVDVRRSSSQSIYQ
jgi:hypothetical protein